MKEFQISQKVFLTLCLLLTSIIAYSQNIADFSGEWILNKSLSKSSLSQLATSTMVISQDGMSLTINITITPENQQPIKRTVKYVMNVSMANKVAKPEDKAVRLDTKLAPDGQSFSVTETISFTKDGAFINQQRVDTYSIGKDGSTLTIKTDDLLPEKSMTPKQALHETRIYDKKIE